MSANGSSRPPSVGVNQGCRCTLVDSWARVGSTDITASTVADSVVANSVACRCERFLGATQMLRADGGSSTLECSPSRGRLTLTSNLVKQDSLTIIISVRES